MSMQKSSRKPHEKERDKAKKGLQLWGWEGFTSREDSGKREQQVIEIGSREGDADNMEVGEYYMHA